MEGKKLRMLSFVRTTEVSFHLMSSPDVWLDYINVDMLNPLQDSSFGGKKIGPLEMQDIR